MTRVERVPPDERAWDALCDDAGTSPFARPSWVIPWVSAFAPRETEFVTATQSGVLVGLMPVRRRFGVSWSATNWHTPLYEVVARDADVEAALLGRALEIAPALILRFVDTASRFAGHAGRAGLDVSLVRRTMLESPRIDIDCSWDEYEGRLSKSMVKTLRRRRRRLEEEGDLTIEVVQDRADAERRLEEGLDLEHAGWKGRNKTSIKSDPRVLGFYRHAARRAAADGRLALSFLRLDGRPIAFHLDLVDGDVVYGLKGAYAEDASAHSPSRVLRHERIKAAFDQGMRRYEFLGADEPYKAEWANAATTLDSLEFYRGSVAGRTARLVGTHGRAAARRALSLGAIARQSVAGRRRSSDAADSAAQGPASNSR